MAQAYVPSNDQCRHQFKTKTGIEIVIYVDDILKLTAEGIVIGEGSTFKRLGHVATSLLKTDPKFKESRDKLIATNKNSFKLWNAYSSRVGKNFKFVIHAVIAQCKQSKEDAWKNNMIGLYKKVFDEADGKKINVLALTLLGSGKGMASEEVAAEAAIMAIKPFKGKYLRKIYVVTNDDTIRDVIVEQCTKHIGHCRPLPMPTGSHSRPNPRSLGWNDGGSNSVGAQQPSSSAGRGRATPERREEPQTSSSRSDFRQKYTRQASSHEATQDRHLLGRGRSTIPAVAPTGNKKDSGRHAEHKVNDHGSRFPERSHRFNTGDSDNDSDTSDERESSFIEESNEASAAIYRTTIEETKMNGVTCMTVSACSEKHDGEGVNYSTRKKEELERGNKNRENKHTTGNPRDAHENESYKKTNNNGTTRDGYEGTPQMARNLGTQKHQFSDVDYEGTSKRAQNTDATSAIQSSGLTTLTGEVGVGQQETTNLEETCPICLSEITHPKKLSRCGHIFCRDCIDNSFANFKPVCPSCNMVYGVLYGSQPDGTMNVDYDGFCLPGYERYGTISITYHFPNGKQGPNHPSPGSYYKGTTRVAYLPNNKEGQEVLKLLKTAFDRKLTFTIGRSTTTGHENVVTWNDIHHKTNIEGGPTRFGYPDPTYLNRVKEELASKGVTM